MLEMSYPMIRRLTRTLGGPDIHFLPEDREKQEAIIRALPADMPLKRDFMKKAHQMLSSLPSGVLHEITLFQTVVYVVLHSSEKHHFLLIGPCISEPFRKEEFEAKMIRLDVPGNLIATMTENVRPLPAIPEDRLQAVSTIIGKSFLETDDEIPYRKSSYSFKLEEEQNAFIVSHSYEEIEKIRRVETRYESGAAFTEAVLEGNLALAYEFIGHMRLDSSDLKRASNPLRNSKNLLLAMNTQLRTALQRSNVTAYQLDAISGKFAREIENAMGVDELRTISREIPREYCELSRETRYGKLPRISREVATLIKDNLSEPINVQELASTLSVNADYLSYRFHEETGETIKDFLNRERCEMAAKLLESTSMQIQTIANTVGFNSTSYFSKMFSRFFHMSPKEFRNKERSVE